MDLRVIQQHEAEDATHYFPTLEQGPLYLAVALAGEVGEACNDIKKYARGDVSHEWELLQAKLEGELPDILIYLVMLADNMGIDLETAYHDKKAYNDKRFRAVQRHPSFTGRDTGGVDLDPE